MELSKVLNKISQEFLTAHLHVNTFPRTALKEMFLLYLYDLWQ